MLILFPKKDEKIDMDKFMSRMDAKYAPPSLDEILKGKVGNVGSIFEQNRQERKLNAYTGRGYSKKRDMKMLFNVPKELYFNKEASKYFQRGMDAKERMKHALAFARRFPQCLTTEKI